MATGKKPMSVTGPIALYFFFFFFGGGGRGGAIAMFSRAVLVQVHRRFFN